MRRWPQQYDRWTQKYWRVTQMLMTTKFITQYPPGQNTQIVVTFGQASAVDQNIYIFHQQKDRSRKH